MMMEILKLNMPAHDKDGMIVMTSISMNHMIYDIDDNYNDDSDDIDKVYP